MLCSSLCDQSDAYILGSKTITITGAGTDDAAKQLEEREKELKIKNYAPFIDCTSEINNTQIDYAKDLDDVMVMYKFNRIQQTLFKNIRTFMAVL